MAALRPWPVLVPEGSDQPAAPPLTAGEPQQGICEGLSGLARSKGPMPAARIGGRFCAGQRN
jgi:hypothetical protein